MERMCPLGLGLGGQFNETVKYQSVLYMLWTNLTSCQYFSEFSDAINYITLDKGAYALLDPHNYMRYG